MKKFALVFCAALCLTTTAVSVNAQQNETGNEDSQTQSKPSKFSSDLRTPQPNKTVSRFKYSRPTAKERFKKYVKSNVGLSALATTAVTSGISHYNDSPEEWEDDSKGYARRFGSSFAQRAIRTTVIYGLDETLRVDSNFYKKGKGEKFNKRLINALISPVTARKPNGRRVVGIPRIVGTYSSSIIAREAWYPERFDYKDGLRTGTISLGINAAINLVREFILPIKFK